MSVEHLKEKRRWERNKRKQAINNNNNNDNDNDNKKVGNTIKFLLMHDGQAIISKC